MKRKIEISEFSDFCFGVKRAISLAEKALKKYPKPVFSLGPLIHNQQVVDRLSEKGLNVVSDTDKIKSGTAVICSHGLHPDALENLKKRHISLINTTCPFVKNAQILAKKLSEQGYNLIIVGDKGHPEVKSLRGFSGNKALVVAGTNDARRHRIKRCKIGIIAQTTQSLEDFQEVISELLKKKFSEARIFNTICNDASMRQKATKRLSNNNEVMFVVGGRNSANTKNLYKICRSMGAEAYHVENAREIKDEWLEGRKRIGVVSGASTPRWIVDDVVDRLKNIE